MKYMTKSIVACTLALVAAVPVMAQSTNRFFPANPSQSSRRVTVSYRNARQQTRTFNNLTEARQFQTRVQRLGYQTSLRRRGRQYQVSYRQTRFRQRSFTGANALREGTNFHNRLRRLGYETRMQIRRATQPGQGGTFNPQQLVGQSESAARRLAQRRNLSVRVVSRDGRSFPVTRDFRTDRVNLSIIRGRVVRATIG